MNRSIRVGGLLSLLAFAPMGAQTPPAGGPAPGGWPGPRREINGPPAAEMLLSNAGELELTDAQVVRLAAIARRSAARRRSVNAAMDSAHARFTQPGDSIGRQQFRQRMDAELRRVEEQVRTDQRDAIAVLTPDQQARAWNMVANSRVAGGPGRGMRGAGGERRMVGRGRGDFGRVGPRRERMQPRRPMRRGFGNGE